MRIVLCAALFAASCVLCFAQEPSTTLSNNNASTTVNSTIGSGTPAANAVESDPFLANRIPLNSKIYIAPFKSEDPSKPVEGFETYMAAAIRKKGVPVIVVADRSQADFEIAGTADKKGAGFAKKFLLGDFRSTASASITVTNLRTGVVAYADASHRASPTRASVHLRKNSRST